MGMSGLARGREPWVMKSAFVVRGLSALLLVAALPTVLGAGGAALAGLVLFWIWGGGSAALALVDTDMPGETPSRAGAAHTWIALVAYVAGVAGAIVLSLALRGDEATAGVARWALPIALAAAVALVVQFAGFAAAARQAQDAAAGLQATGSHAVPGLGASAGSQPPAATPSLALSGVAPALEAPASAVAPPASPASPLPPASPPTPASSSESSSGC